METTRSIAHKCRLFEVAVIGGSLAGAATALQLARSGIKVVLLEKASFPRVKACGEGLSVLCSLDKRLALLSRRPFSGYSVHKQDGSISRISFADEIRDSGAGIKREILDSALMAAAERAGAEVYANEKLLRIEASSGGYRLRTAQRSLRAQYAVFAEGGNTSFPEALGFPSIKRKHTRSGTTLRVSGRITNEPAHVHVVLAQDYQVCVTPLGEESLNISILSGRGGSRQWQDDRTLNALLAELSRMIDLDVFEVCEKLPVGGICRRRRAAFFEKSLTVGDGCEQLDPIGGMGMTHALLTSKLAAEALRWVLKENVSPSRAFSAYAKSRELSVKPYRGFTRLAYWGLVEYPKNKFFMGLSRTPLAEDAGRAAHGNRAGRCALTWQLLKLVGTELPAIPIRYPLT